MPTLYNPELKTILKGYPGVELDKNKRFINQYNPFNIAFSDVIKWQRNNKEAKKNKKNNTFNRKIIFGNSLPNKNINCILLIGHATFIIQLNGIRIITDPVFFGIGPVKRLSKIPYNTAEFKDIDILLLSHDHRDHCDSKSLKIIKHQNPNIKVCTGLKNEKIIQSIFGNSAIQSAGWYQQFTVEFTLGLEITYLPTRHWCRRFLTDTNKHLWGAFMIQSNDINIYFGADSGFDKHYAELPNLFPTIDFCILGIGAYKPEWFMGPSHMGPVDAALAFKQTKAKKLIPMHYGTFDLSDELPMQPEHEIIEIAKRNQWENQLFCLQIGEILPI